MKTCHLECSNHITPKHQRILQYMTIYKERFFYKISYPKYKTDEMIDQLIVHFQWDGELIHKESNEAKNQEEIIETKTNLINEAIRTQEAEDPGASKDIEAIK